MSAPVTVDDLRAVCPKCHDSVRVRRQGAAWRMVAHKRAVSSRSAGARKPLELQRFAEKLAIGLAPIFVRG